MSRPYVVHLRDTDLSRIGQIDRFTTLEMRLVHANISRWLLDMPADEDIVSELAYGRGIVVERDGVTILSGPIAHIEQTWGADVNTIQIAGPDDTVYLRDRLALPVVTGPPYTASAYDVRTGVASTIMRQYVDNNVGPSAQVARRQAGLVLETVDPLVGSTVTGRARFDNLLELVQSLALAGGDLGFRVVQSSTAAQLRFEVFQPVDKTDLVIFSPRLGNLRAFRYSTDVAEANYVVVAGGGEGVARTFYESSTPASITLFGRRIEQFIDRRDTTVVGELTQEAVEQLAAKAAKSSLSVTPIDTEGLAFMTDYQLGDRVTVVANAAKPGRLIPPSVTIEDVVREIHIIITESAGETIEPSVGTPESGRLDLLSVFSRVGKSESRISNLERR